MDPPVLKDSVRRLRCSFLPATGDVAALVREGAALPGCDHEKEGSDVGPSTTESGADGGSEVRLSGT